MNVKILVFIISVEAIIYLLLYNLHVCTFNGKLHFCAAYALFLEMTTYPFFVHLSNESLHEYLKYSTTTIFHLLLSTCNQRIHG